MSTVLFYLQFFRFFFGVCILSINRIHTLGTSLFTISPQKFTQYLLQVHLLVKQVLGIQNMTQLLQNKMPVTISGQSSEGAGSLLGTGLENMEIGRICPQRVQNRKRKVLGALQRERLEMRLRRIYRRGTEVLQEERSPCLLNCTSAF